MTRIAEVGVVEPLQVVLKVSWAVVRYILAYFHSEKVSKLAGSVFRSISICQSVYVSVVCLSAGLQKRLNQSRSCP